MTDTRTERLIKQAPALNISLAARTTHLNDARNGCAHWHTHGPRGDYWAWCLGRHFDIHLVYGRKI